MTRRYTPPSKLILRCYTILVALKNPQLWGFLMGRFGCFLERENPSIPNVDQPALIDGFLWA